MANGLQVHLFEDLGVEMVPESNGHMCLNHGKNLGFCEVSLFPLIHDFSSPRVGLGCHF